MTTADPSIQVQVFKEGLLSRLGHDLGLSLRRFEVELADGKLTARFFPDSLVVDGAMRRGRLDTSALSDADREKIHRAICTEILFTTRHPEALLQADVRDDPEGVRVEGNLTLVGTRRSLPDIVLHRVDERLRSEILLAPSRWGIKPYRALGGALRLQDKLVVILDFPAPPGVTATAGAHTWARRG
jgi:hypothetical protein